MRYVRDSAVAVSAAAAAADAAEDSPSSSILPISSLGRFRCALGPNVLPNGSVSTMWGRCLLHEPLNLIVEKKEIMTYPTTVLGIVLQQTHRQLVPLEQDRVWVRLLLLQGSPKMVERGLRDDSRIAYRRRHSQRTLMLNKIKGCLPNHRLSGLTRPGSASFSPFWKAAASTILPSRSLTALPPLSILTREADFASR